MSRIPPATRDTLLPDQAMVYDELHQTAGDSFGDNFTWQRRDGALVGPFPAFLAAPEAGIGLLQHIGKVALIPGLPANARETAILSTGAHFKATYELYAHGRLAVKTTDLTQEQVDQICDSKKPEGLDEACSIAYDVAKYLSNTRGPLGQDLWDLSVKTLGRDGTLALVHYVGVYAYTCIILNAMDAPVPEEGD